MEKKVGETGKWVRTATEVKTIDSKGLPLLLKDVPAEKNEATGALRVNPEDVAKAEIEQIAGRQTIEGRHLPLLLMLVAKPGPFKEGAVESKYKLNKMLFYQWKRLANDGLGDSFPRDDFKSARAGPVPIHLKEDLRALEKAGLVTVKWSNHPGASTHVELTAKGLEAAKRLWDEVPGIYRDATVAVKEELFPLTPQTIKEKVHNEFPELVRVYVEVDAE